MRSTNLCRWTRPPAACELIKKPPGQACLMRGIIMGWHDPFEEGMGQDHRRARQEEILNKIKGPADDFLVAIGRGRVAEEFHGRLRPWLRGWRGSPDSPSAES